MSHSHIFLVRIKNKLIAVFVYGIVGKMHANVLHVVFVGDGILLGGEPCQSFFVNIHLQRINACHENVNSQVKL
jgi:hypothetical protein